MADGKTTVLEAVKTVNDCSDRDEPAVSIKVVYDENDMNRPDHVSSPAHYRNWPEPLREVIRHIISILWKYFCKTRFILITG